MFSKISRYRKLPDDVAIDFRGRKLVWKNLRLLPEVSGTFQHIVEDVDRLDHLAFKYYTQPRNWWRICDANPEFLSPQALLGKGPLITQRFPVSFRMDVKNPPWAGLLAQLRAIVGVEEVQLELGTKFGPKTEDIDDERVTFITEELQRVVVITYNRMNTGVAELSEIINDADFDASEPETLGRVGKKIVIPPAVAG